MFRLRMTDHSCLWDATLGHTNGNITVQIDVSLCPRFLFINRGFNAFVQWRDLFLIFCIVLMFVFMPEKVQVGNDQEKAQSEKDFHSKNLGGKKPN